MPIYCYKCEECGNTWENFTHNSNDQDKVCPECNKNNIHRNYIAEKIVVFSDVPEHMDLGIGEIVKGRRDRATKYKAMGLRPLNGDSLGAYKNYYDDEKVHNEVMVSRRNPIDDVLDKAMAESLASGDEDVQHG